MQKFVKAIAVGAVLASAIGVGIASPAEAKRPVACTDVLLPAGACPADAGAAVAECCPCSGHKNHGSYVSCVAHAVNALRKANCLDKEARTSMKRCAARSTCGKPEGFVTCCKTTPGACMGGFCEEGSAGSECMVDADCPSTTKCSIKRDATTCEAQGGLPGEGSCCNACSATP
jgi:hypothetical protein